jgi:hypothetical protein
MEITNLEKDLNLRPGSVILEYGNSFIAKGIRWWMKVYRRKLNVKTGRVFNHVAMFVKPKGFDNIKVGESIAKGYTIRPFEDTYYNKRNYVILDPIKPLTLTERELFSKECVKLTFKITRYQFSNFIFQMVLIVTGKWYGKRNNKAENRMYCSQAFANIYNKVRPGTFNKDHAINPFDILIHKEFEMRDMDRFFSKLDNYNKGITIETRDIDTILKKEVFEVVKEEAQANLN